jgi:HPt (histidine-containing phosphotransfer) domain-containing protein
MQFDLGAICNIPESLGRLGGSKELLRDIIGFFQEDAPEILGTIHKAIDGRDAEQLSRAAHSLKGLAANFSARSTVEAAARVEELGRSNRWPLIPSAVDALAQQVEALMKALAEYRESSGA